MRRSKGEHSYHTVREHTAETRVSAKGTDRGKKEGKREKREQKQAGEELGGAGLGERTRGRLAMSSQRKVASQAAVGNPKGSKMGPESRGPRRASFVGGSLERDLGTGQGEQRGKGVGGGEGETRDERGGWVSASQGRVPRVPRSEAGCNCAAALHWSAQPPVKVKPNHDPSSART